MKPNILYIFLFLFPSFSLFTWQGESFEKIIKDYQFQFSFSRDFQKIETKENPNLYYDYAIKHSIKKLEIRYFVGLPAPKMDGVDFEKIGLYKQQALTTAANVCQCMDKINKSDLSADTLSLFNADWGANFFLEATSEFGQGYKYSIVTAVHKKDLPDLYTIFLFDDFDSVKQEIQKAVFNLKFKQESNLDKSYRGVKFIPAEKQVVGDMTISIPNLANRSESLHNQDKYPITFFRIDCQNEKECFSIMIAVSIIPESRFTFEQLVEEAKTNEFEKSPHEMVKWLEILKFKTDKTTILLGPGKVLGTKLIAFYQKNDKKETYRINMSLVYHPNFPEEDWKNIITHTFFILDSVTIK
ncbi:hypothetical protein JWG41_05955 [Leptospira sp. 201903075]|uniref:hypothetical protein n=1 Tax=Leptospira chreensis TaxID=2810035 RepID=UPI001963AB7B|nr:hypothetical protein [Leptospira chreensis]MBM9589980.1 hypothetical protein [Leptospira chreensis]